MAKESVTALSVKTPSGKRPRPVIEIVKAVGEMLDNLVEGLDPYTDTWPAWAQSVVTVVPILLAHPDVVLAVTAAGVRATRRAATRLWLCVAAVQRVDAVSARIHRRL